MSLSDEQLAVLVEAVEAVVERDRARLGELVDGMDVDELYVWTENYGAGDRVDLVRPPGPPEEWEIDAVDVAGDPPEVHVIVAMWTRQEGRSDLSLEVRLREKGPGAWSAAIEDLHVL